MNIESGQMLRATVEPEFTGPFEETENPTVKSSQIVVTKDGPPLSMVSHGCLPIAAYHASENIAVLLQIHASYLGESRVTQFVRRLTLYVFEQFPELKESQIDIIVSDSDFEAYGVQIPKIHRLLRFGFCSCLRSTPRVVRLSNDYRYRRISLNSEERRCIIEAIDLPDGSPEVEPHVIAY